MKRIHAARPPRAIALLLPTAAFAVALSFGMAGCYGSDPVAPAVPAYEEPVHLETSFQTATVAEVLDLIDAAGQALLVAKDEYSLIQRLVGDVRREGQNVGVPRSGGVDGSLLRKELVDEIRLMEVYRRLENAAQEATDFADRAGELQKQLVWRGVAGASMNQMLEATGFRLPTDCIESADQVAMMDEGCVTEAISAAASGLVAVGAVGTAYVVCSGTAGTGCPLAIPTAVGASADFLVKGAAFASNCAIPWVLDQVGSYCSDLLLDVGALSEWWPEDDGMMVEGLQVVEDLLTWCSGLGDGGMH